MIDSHGRRIHYLRVSITDRCNLRCRYCMPEMGLRLLPREQIVRFEEIIEVVRQAVAMGVDKVRLTGGEPLVRRDVVGLVESLSRVEGLADLSMTTNGILLPPVAADLKSAGLRRVNISLDTMVPQRFAEITRGGDVRAVVVGIESALAAGLTPVKLNCVVGSWSLPSDLESVRAFAAGIGVEVRAITAMDFSRGYFGRVMGGHGGDCPRCNRLRLLSDGMIRPCLFSDRQFSIRELGPAEAIRQALAAKPAAGAACHQNWMHGIGG